MGAPQVFPPSVELNHGWGAVLVSRNSHPDAAVQCGFYWTEPGEETAFSFEKEDPRIPGYVHWPAMDDIYVVFEGALEIDWEGQGERGTLRLESHDIAYLTPGYRYRTRCVSNRRTKVFYCGAPAPNPDERPHEHAVKAAKAELAAGQG
jgi:hypothetical protein